MKILSIVGARPQFVKAAGMSRVIRERHTEVLVHTGQHYDDRMSAVFFEELGIPEPEYNLGIGSGPHGAQTGAMLARIEEVATRGAPRLGAGLRRHELHAGGRPGGGQAAHPRRPCRGGPAQLQPPHARGGEPRGGGPPLRSPLLPQPDGGREPGFRGDPARVFTSSGT